MITRLWCAASLRIVGVEDVGGCGGCTCVVCYFLLVFHTCFPASLLICGVEEIDVCIFCVLFHHSYGVCHIITHLRDMRLHLWCDTSLPCSDGYL